MNPDQAPPPEPNSKISKIPPWIIWVAGILIVFIVLALLLHHPNKKQSTTHNAIVPVSIQITSKGFVPASVQINKDTTVIWTNIDSAPHRVAANPYPTHTDLPGLDSKTNIGTNGTYQYKFEASGTFGYHDELHPEHNGTIKVE